MPLPRSPASSTHSAQPDLTSQNDGDQNLKVNTRKRKNPDDESFHDFCMDIKAMFKDFQIKQENKFENLNKTIETIKLQNSKLIDSNNEIERLLQENKDECNELKKRVSNLEVECVNAHVKIDKLEEQLDDIYKYRRRNIIEIRSIPKASDEDLTRIVQALAKIVNVDININEIKQIYRRGKENAPIIVEFQNMATKMNILKATKTYNIKNKMNKLNSEDLGFICAKVPIYVSEMLTGRAKILLSSAKKLVEDGLFKYCWVSHGTVLLRQYQGQPAIRITSSEQLEVLKSNNKPK